MAISHGAPTVSQRRASPRARRLLANKDNRRLNIRRAWLASTLHLDNLGSQVIGLFAVLGDAAYLLVNALAPTELIHRGHASYLRRTLIQQIYFTAAQAMPLVLLVGAALGLLAMLPMVGFGVTDLNLLTAVIDVVLIHQVAPVLIVLMVIGRSGTAITAELSELHINQAAVTLLAMGIEPHRLFLLPRLIGMVISLLLLNFWGGVAALAAAGLFASVSEGLTMGAFLSAFMQHLQWSDVVLTALMNVAYGTAVVSLQMRYAEMVSEVTDIPRNLPRAFVASLLACLLITVVFTLARSG